MKQLFFVVLVLIEGICHSQDFVFDVTNNTLKCPYSDMASQWEIGSSEINIILQTKDDFRDTIFLSIGCSQYLVEICEDSTNLIIYCWPFTLYETDCAVEDSHRPNKNSSDFKVVFCFYWNRVVARLQWNLDKYSSNEVFDSDLDYSFMTSIFKMMEQGFSIQDIILKLESQEKELDIISVENLYRNDVVKKLLPLHNMSFDDSTMRCLTDSFKYLRNEYNR